MITQDLLDYINAQLQNGVNEADIRQSLLNNGWNQDDVEAAFKGKLQSDTASPQTPPPLSKDEAVAAIFSVNRRIELNAAIIVVVKLSTVCAETLVEILVACVTESTYIFINNELNCVFM